MAPAMVAPCVPAVLPCVPAVMAPALAAVMAARGPTGFPASKGDVMRALSPAAITALLRDNDEGEDRGGDQHADDRAAVRTRVHRLE